MCLFSVKMIFQKFAIAETYLYLFAYLGKPYLCINICFVMNICGRYNTDSKKILVAPIKTK